MVEVWWPLLGAVIPAIVGGQAWRIRKRRAEEQRLKSVRGREKSSEEIFVCERVCTSKRMLKKVGSFSKDPTPDTCVTVCGVSQLDACADTTNAISLSLSLFHLTTHTHSSSSH